MARISLAFAHLSAPSPTLRKTYVTEGYLDTDAACLVLPSPLGPLRVPLTAVREYKLSTQAVHTPPDAPEAPPDGTATSPKAEPPPKPNAAQKKR